MNSRTPVQSQRWLPWAVLVVASLLLAGSAAAAASGFGQWQPAGVPASGNPGAAPAPWSGSGPGNQPVGPGGMGNRGPGGMGNRGGGTMNGHVWLAGNGVPVATIAQARARAVAAGAGVNLHPGEVMQFSQNFYVELKDANGASAAEVLVDPATGAVTTEYGPAMMWTDGTATLTLDQAKAVASQWLQANAKGQTVASADAFPGHYTMDTTSGGVTVGMLSVNATTGAVWYHTWHGSFIAKEDA
ncbi:hypothetical protein [Propionicimonas sp.]|uniref:hypothetical protein n=1 Tax=Propionicimonas sp. TaxID=1955623 RepID=UPI0025FEB796|nr:hypothetical protein [Propionicimonas sp.]MCG2805291.1 hypothetical protein [Propionicimonas sp.]